MTDNQFLPEQQRLALRVQQAQTEQLYRQTRGALAGMAVVATVLCVLQWTVVPHRQLLWWLGVLLSTGLARAALLLAYERARPAGGEALLWAHRHTLGTLFSGLLWAVPALFFWPQSSPLHQLIWCLCILPLSAASVVTYYACTPSYLAALLLTSVPLAVRLLVEGGAVFTVLGLLCVYFIYTLMRAGKLLHTENLATLETGFRNQALSLNLQQEIAERAFTQRELEQRNEQLQGALGSVKQLSGLLPICGSCKKIRNDKGYWEQIEAFIRQRSEAQFSHGICPDCARRQYPDIFP